MISDPQRLILFRMNSSTKDFDPKGAPRCLCPWVVMLTPEPRKCSSAAGRCSGLTTSHVLPGLGLYPKCGPHDTKLSHHTRRSGVLPPADTSSPYQRVILRGAFLRKDVVTIDEKHGMGPVHVSEHRSKDGTVDANVS